MTDDLLPGLGWIESPPDDRDWPIHALYAAAGIEPPAVLPPAYHVPAPLYPVVDQGSSPMCVAYSAAGEQGWYDLRDTGLALFHEALFFRQIGGTANGAVIRDALDERLSRGYPVSGHPELAAQHRIAAYYAVPVTQTEICAAILAFGPLVIGTPWANSWFHPRPDGTLPPFDRSVGGHAIHAVGWGRHGPAPPELLGRRLGSGRRGHPAVGGAAQRPRGLEGSGQDRAQAHPDLADPRRPRRHRRPLRARRARPARRHPPLPLDWARQRRALRSAGSEARRGQRPGDGRPRHGGRVQGALGTDRRRRQRLEHERCIARGGPRVKVSGTFAPAAFVILIGCVGGLLAALFPSDANPWVVPVTAALTAFAALVRTEFHVPESDAP